jgi:hypothetical protein
MCGPHHWHSCSLRSCVPITTNCTMCGPHHWHSPVPESPFTLHHSGLRRAPRSHRRHINMRMRVLVSLCACWPLLTHPRCPHTAHTDCTTATHGLRVQRYGIDTQLQLAHDLAGDGGWVLFTFAGIDNTTTAAPSDWVSAVRAAAALNLNVVARLSPPWGSSHFRDEADDAPGLAPSAPRQRFETLATCVSRHVFPPFSEAYCVTTSLGSYHR